MSVRQYQILDALLDERPISLEKPLTDVEFDRLTGFAPEALAEELSVRSWKCFDAVPFWTWVRLSVFERTDPTLQLFINFHRELSSFSQHYKSLYPVKYGEYHKALGSRNPLLHACLSGKSLVTALDFVLLPLQSLRGLPPSDLLIRLLVLQVCYQDEYQGCQKFTWTRPFSIKTDLLAAWTGGFSPAQLARKMTLTDQAVVSRLGLVDIVEDSELYQAIEIAWHRLAREATALAPLCSDFLLQLTTVSSRFRRMELFLLLIPMRCSLVTAKAQ